MTFELEILGQTYSMDNGLVVMVVQPHRHDLL